MIRPGSGPDSRRRGLTILGAVGLCAVCCPPLLLVPAPFLTAAAAATAGAVSSQLGTAESFVAAVLAVGLIAAGLVKLLRARRSSRELQTGPVELPMPTLPPRPQP